MRCDRNTSSSNKYSKRCIIVMIMIKPTYYHTSPRTSRHSSYPQHQTASLTTTCEAALAQWAALVSVPHGKQGKVYQHQLMQQLNFVLEMV